MDHETHDDDAPTVVGPPDPPPPEPADGTAKDRRPRSQTWPLLLWTLRFGMTVAAALALLGIGFMLGIFGLPGVALGVAVGFVAGAALLWRRGILPAAVLATAIALPATVATLSTVRFDRSLGTVIIQPQRPVDLDGRDIRRGAGAILLDLRHFTAPAGSTTSVAARADNGRIVVALPTSRCIGVHVHYDTLSIDGTVRGAARAAFDMAGLNGGGTGVGFGPSGVRQSFYEAHDRIFQNATEADRSALNGLLAYGIPPSRPHEYLRATDGNAPVVDLTLRATDQIVLRDYPPSAGPLDDGYYGDGSQVAGMNWPQSLRAPQSPGQVLFERRADVRTRANRAMWVAWERRMIAWATKQAKRYAGACANDVELRDRAVAFLTQPQRVRDSSGRVTELLGGPTTRDSPITGQKTVAKGRLLQVEVNGLGEVHIVRTVRDDGDITYQGAIS